MPADSPDGVCAYWAHVSAITLQPIESSNIKAVGYDPAGRKLCVEFRSGAVHDYHDVPGDVHQALLTAKSIGAYHANFFKGRFKSTKVA